MPNKQKRRSVEAKGRGGDSKTLYEQKEEQQVELIDRILSEENLKKAIKAVKQNKGAPGIDNMTVDELDALSMNYSRIYPRASRCGVFAKTDIQPLLNQGARKEDIARSVIRQ